MMGEKLFIIGSAGLALYWLMPLVNVFRISTLQIVDGIVLTFILMMLVPILWIIYAFMSILALKKELEGAVTG